MGNKIAKTTQSSASEYYLHDLPSSYNLVLKEVLCRGRFFKSIQCKHDEGLVLVKVYFKRGDHIDLREHEKRLLHIRDTFLAIQNPHVWPFQFWLETDKAAYLLRQYFFNNLHDRLSTRPFLSVVEKKWLAFQLLWAVKQSHECGICHGDIKCENVLVTTWNWVYLADFASFKPTYIPHDDPSDFSFFFDTGGRRLCYLAPERFYEHGKDTPVAPDAPLKPSMDIFAMGCVIAEVFLEGHPLFELSQLLAYRRGQYDPSPHLEKIHDPGIRMMILHMIQLNPDERLSAEGYLLNYAGVAFPNYFSPFLRDFYSCLSSLDPDARVVMCQNSFHEIFEQMTHDESGDGTSEELEVPPNAVSSMTSQQMVVKEVHNRTNGFSRNENLTNGSVREQVDLLDDLASLLREVDQYHFSTDKSWEVPSKSHAVQKQEQRENSSSNRLFQKISGVFKRSEHAFLKKITIDELKSLMSQYNSEADTYQMPFENLPRERMSCEGMVLITSLLCSSLRNIKFPQLKRSCILLLKSLSVYIDDEDCLQHVLPYVIFMLSDPAAIVRSAAIETICDILPLVREFPPSDAKIFPEYILPMLSMFPDDAEESVRICYASNISKLALTSYGFFIHSISMSKAGVLDELSATQKSSVPSINNGNVHLSHLRKSVAEVVRELVMGPKQSPKIRRALLQDIAGLCCFFGQKQTNDFLLPILPAFLNDNDEHLRTVFYEQIVYVCLFVGQRSVEDYLLPYIDQALSDTSEGVIANTLGCLTILCDNGFLRKGILIEIIQHAFPLLCYPSQWVRNSVASFVASSSESLGVVDSYVFVAPVVHPFLRRQLASLTSQKDLLSCLKPPVSKKVFYQVLENARGLDMAERQRKIWHASTQSKQGENVSTPKKGRDPEIGKLSIEQMERIKRDNGEVRLRAFGASSTLDIRDHLKFSGLTSPQLSGMRNVLLNKSSENIPLYSLDKREVGNSQAANDASQRLRSLRMSSSLSIAYGTKQFHRVVHEPESKESDQRNSVSIEDVSNSSAVTSLSWISTLPDSGWKPRGVLVAHLQEHRSSVNGIAASTDGNFFLSVSDDSTVKLWESRKLEKDMSFRSRMTYSLEGSRGLCAIMLCGSTQVVVGSCDGRLHTFCVDYTSRGLENGNIIETCSGISNVNKMEIEEGAILSIVNSSEAYSDRTVMYSTQSSGIHLWDARARKISWTLKANPEEGYISKLVTDPCGNWFVSGSSRGVLSLWDLRFLIPVKSWAYPRQCQIEDMCLYIPPPNTPLSANAKPLIYVAAGFNEVSLWNAETGSCHQVFQVPVNNSDVPWALSKGNPTLNSGENVHQKYRVEEFNEPPPRIPGIRSLLPLPGGDLLTAGTDLKIRRWDQSRPERSYCICGPTIKGLGNDEVYEIRSSFRAQLVQEMRTKPVTAKLTRKAVVTAAATDPAGCHRDAILSLASVKLNQRLLISSGRDGAIKVWK